MNIQILLSLLLVFMPSSFKIFCLRLMGHEIGNGCYIGFSLISAKKISVGNNCIIAGRYSQFFTHSITPTNLYDRRAIAIGDWCYIGSAVRVVPGCTIPDYSFVGMGSVITRSFEESYLLHAGAPAIIKKKLAKESIFFNRTHHRQPHHPLDYKG